MKLVSSFNTVRRRWTVHLYRKYCFKSDNHETGFRRTEPELEDPQSTFAFCLVWSGPRERERFLLLNRAGSLPNGGIILRGTGGSQLCHAPLDSANDSTTNRGSEKKWLHPVALALPADGDSASDAERDQIVLSVALICTTRRRI